MHTKINLELNICSVYAEGRIFNSHFPDSLYKVEIKFSVNLRIIGRKDCSTQTI